MNQKKIWKVKIRHSTVHYISSLRRVKPSKDVASRYNIVITEGARCSNILLRQISVSVRLEKQNIYEILAVIGFALRSKRRKTKLKGKK